MNYLKTSYITSVNTMGKLDKNDENIRYLLKYLTKKKNDQLGTIIIDNIIHNDLLPKYIDRYMDGNKPCGIYSKIKKELNADIDLVKQDEEYVEKLIDELYPFVVPSRCSSMSITEWIKFRTLCLIEICNYQPKQGSDMWFQQRKKFITASGAHKAFNKNAKKTYYKYIFERVTGASTLTGTEAPLVWGNKYEPISAMLYMKKEAPNSTLYDIGLVYHPNDILTIDGESYPIAASPDGLVVDENGMGHLLEIKSPYSRDPKADFISGNYDKQIQMQLACCQLRDAQFYDCQLKLYDNEEQYLMSDHPDKGLVLVNRLSTDVRDHMITYRYPPKLFDSDEEYLEWAKEESLKFKYYLEELKFKAKIECDYWFLSKANNIRVRYDHDWVTKKGIPAWKETWETIEEYKINGLPEKEDDNLMYEIGRSYNPDFVPDSEYMHAMPVYIENNEIIDKAIAMIDEFKKIFQSSKDIISDSSSDSE